MKKKEIQANFQFSEGHKNPNWPIHPFWLSMKKGIKEGNIRPNEDGIFMPDTIRGFVVESSDHPDINNPISLFQVVPKNYDYEDTYKRIEVVESKSKYINLIVKDRKIIRIDPGNLYKNIECCDLFRQCKFKNRNGHFESCTSKCFDMDSRIALFFHKRLSGIHYFEENEKYIREFEKIKELFNYSLIKERSEHSVSPIEVVTYEVIGKNNKPYKRIYIKYRCIYSGFDEYFFPIIHFGRVIAVIMQGQRPNPELADYPMFSDFIDESKEGILLRKNIESIKLNKKFLSEESLSEARIDGIYDRIISLAKRINDKVNSISQLYVSEEFQKIETYFRKSFKGIKSDGVDSFVKYKQLLNEILNEIFYTFNTNGFINIYFLKKKHKEVISDIDEFELIGHSNVPQYKKLEFKNLPKDRDKIEGEELLEYLLEPCPKDESIFKKGDVFRFEMPFVSDVSYIVWKRYNDLGGNFYHQKKMYGNTLKLFYHVLIEPYIILKEISIEQMLETSIRISVHETGQIIPSIIQTLSANFYIDSNDDTIPIEIKTLHESFLNDIKEEKNFKELFYGIRDTINRLELIDSLFTRSSLSFKKVEPKYQWVDFHQIIYSTKAIFGDRAFLNNRQEIVINFSRILSRYKLYTDKTFIGQILFNLVDNAIKYGVRGSKISITVKLEEENEDWLKYDILNFLKEIVIVVESFGDEISEDSRENIFELYYRSPKNRHTEGLGMGLYLVKRLCHSMGYEIACCKSEFVDNLNLPLFYHYRKQRGNDSLVLAALENRRSETEYIRLQYNLGRVVNKSYDKPIDWKIDKYTFSESIKISEKIYNNKFEIRIPISNNLKNKKYE